MDPKERLKNLSELLVAAMQGWQADMWSAMPGIIQSVNWLQQTAVVQLSIQIDVRNIQTGVVTSQTISPLLDCPLYFPHGGSMSITFPVVAGDECLVVFASRCIDGWWQNGGIQPQALFRMHDLSDGFVFAGFRSNKNVLSGISQTTLQIRSADGTNVVEVDPVDMKVNLSAGTRINMTAPTVKVIGNLIVDGGLNVSEEATFLDSIEVTGGIETDTLSVGGTDYLAHEHTGVSTGSHNTGGVAP